MTGLSNIFGSPFNQFPLPIPIDTLPQIEYTTTEFKAHRD